MARYNLIGMSVLLVVLAVATAVPSPATNDGEQSPEFQRNLLRWKAMNDGEQQQIRERYEDWNGLSSGEQDRVRSNFERFHKLDPQEQRTLRSSHERWIAKADDSRRVALRARMERLRSLDKVKRQSAQAVGGMLYEAGEDVQKGMQSQQRERRRKTIAALRDMYQELPPKLRERLNQMPPWRRQMVIRHIISERRGRFAQLFESTLDVPPERFAMRNLIQQLTREERQIFFGLPPHMKKKLGRMVLRKGTDEQKLKMLRQMLKRFKQGMNRGPRDGRRRNKERPGSGERDKRKKQEE